MRLLILFILISTTNVLKSQNAFIDQSYGNNGSAEIPFEGVNFFLVDFDVDSLERIYISAEFVGNNEDSVAVFLPVYRRLNSAGEIMPRYSEKVRDTSQMYGPLGFGFQWVDNNKILKYYTMIVAEDTIDVLSRFDFEFELEETYDLSLPLWFFGGLFHRPSLDDQFRLMVNDYGLLKRYLSDDTLDPTFGEAGVVRVFDHNNATDTLWHLFYNSLDVTSQNNYVMNSYQNLPDHKPEEPWYDSYITYINEDGSINENFGDQGVKKNDVWEFYQSVAVTEDDAIIVRGIENDLSDTICDVAHSYHMKLDAQGELDQAFSDDAYLEDNDEGCLAVNFNLLSGPEGKLAYLRRLTTSDTTVSDNLGILNSSGFPDSEFNGGQLFSLDELPGDGVLEMIMDEDYNIYVLTTDFQFSFFEPFNFGSMFVTKFMAKDLWDLPSFDSPSQPGALSFYPNPTLGSIYIDYNGPVTEPVTVELYDMLGRKVCSDILQLDHRMNSTIDYSDKLASGNYIINILESNGSKILTDKLIFLR